MKKKWYESKGCWAGVLLMAAAVAKALSELLTTGGVDLQGFIVTAGNGLGLLGIRVAIN